MCVHLMDDALSYSIKRTTHYNLVIMFGEDISIKMFVKKTRLNRFKFWMLCKFFPYKIVRWMK